MIDPATLKPGQRLLVHATIKEVGTLAEDSAVPMLTAEITGVRPPFTLQRIQIGMNDVHSLVDDETEPPPPLKIGDRVRDAQGMEFEVTGEPRTTEGGLTKVALWNEVIGYDTDFVSNLEVVA